MILQGHLDNVGCLAFSTNAARVASGSWSINSRGSIIIHSTSSNKVEYQAYNVFLLKGSMVFAIFRMAHLWLVAMMVLRVMA